ncbi:MAG: hypothetical protein ACRDG4_19330 [Chloroflexota bacterium]
MAYIRQSNAPPISAETVETLSRLVGLTLPAEDVAPLAAALTDQLASIALLDRLNLEGVDPIEAFDPRWDDEETSTTFL